MLDLKVYFQHLTIYDYVGFIWLVLTFLILFVLIIYLFRSKPLFTVFMLFVLCVSLPVGFFTLKYFIDKNIRKSDITSKVETLRYTKSLIVEGNITNSGKINYKECLITAKIIKKSNNKIKDFLNSLKPIKKETIFIDKPIDKGESKSFKIMIEGIEYKKDYDTVVSAKCY